MTPKQVVNHFGGKARQVAETARRLRCTRALVYYWLKTGEIPLGRQAQIELATGGKLKAARK